MLGNRFPQIDGGLFLSSQHVPHETTFFQIFRELIVRYSVFLGMMTSIYPIYVGVFVGFACCGLLLTALDFS